MADLRDVAIDAAACFRLTKLVLDDKITERLRERIFERHPPTHGLGFAITCPWCASPYIAAGILLARKMAPRLWQPAAAILTMSAITGLLYEHE